MAFTSFLSEVVETRLNGRLLPLAAVDLRARSEEIADARALQGLLWGLPFGLPFGHQARGSCQFHSVRMNRNWNRPATDAALDLSKSMKSIFLDSFWVWGIQSYMLNIILSSFHFCWERLGARDMTSLGFLVGSHMLEVLIYWEVLLCWEIRPHILGSLYISGRLYILGSPREVPREVQGKGRG